MFFLCLPSFLCGGNPSLVQNGNRLMKDEGCYHFASARLGHGSSFLILSQFCCLRHNEHLLQRHSPGSCPCSWEASKGSQTGAEVRGHAFVDSRGRHYRDTADVTAATAASSEERREVDKGPHKENIRVGCSR